MVEDVGLQRAHEQQRGGARIAATDHAGVHRAAEVIADHDQATARRAVGRVGVERHYY